MSKLAHTDKSCRLGLSNDRKILRPIASLEQVKKIISILEKENLLGSVVIDTSIPNLNEIFVEHPFIFPILQSGEYTLSMAYDITELAIDLSLKLKNWDLYSTDLLPHNFAFIDGRWLLFDFGSISTEPSTVKTEIRGLFEISIMAFELEKILPRKETKHYFLNRFKTKFVKDVLPFKAMCFYFLFFNFCKILLALGCYTFAYKCLKFIFSKYKRNFKRKVLNLSLSDNKKLIADRISSFLNTLEIKTSFSIGEDAADCCLFSNNKNIQSFIYIDDYDKADEYYNYIVENKLTAFSIGVLYPLVFDDAIPKNVKYRALFDDFEKERFMSDLVVSLNIKDFYNNQDISLCSYIENIFHFSKNALILKLDNNEFKYLNEIKNKLLSSFVTVDIEYHDDFILIFAKDKKEEYKSTSEFSYFNYNRGYLSSKHSEKIIEILRSKKNK